MDNGHYEIALSVDNYSEIDATYEKLMSQGVKSILEPITSTKLFQF